MTLQALLARERSLLEHNGGPHAQDAVVAGPATNAGRRKVDRTSAIRQGHKMRNLGPRQETPQTADGIPVSGAAETEAGGAKAAGRRAARAEAKAADKSNAKRGSSDGSGKGCGDQNFWRQPR